MRVKVKFPDHSPLAIVSIQVRIGDVNYGGHVGNDSILSIIHEARLQALRGAGLGELEAGGHGLIMGDVIIAYRGEAFYGDVLRVTIFADEIRERSFDFLYRIETTAGTLIAEARTGMICFDYEQRKIVGMSTMLRAFLRGAQSAG